MASFLRRLCSLFCCMKPQEEAESMTESHEIRSFKRRGEKKEVFTFQRKQRMASLPDQHHDKAVISEHKIAYINLCPKILINEMINSDQLFVAKVLPSDLPECQPEEQDKGGDGSETEYSEKEVIASLDNSYCDDDVDDGEEESELDKKEDFSDAEFLAIPSENNESLYSSDSDNPHHYFCSTEPKVMASELDYCINDEDAVPSHPQEKAVMDSDGDHCEDENENPVPHCPQEKEETKWSKECSDSSDNEDTEMPEEGRELWESLNNTDPEDQFQFYSSKLRLMTSDFSDQCEDEDAVPFCFQKKEDTDSDWSDVEYAGNPRESIEFWNSLHNKVPDNPVFVCLNETKTKASSTKKTGKKVCFSKEVTVHILEEWPIESQEAQDESCWMEMAIDRQRFKRRVELTEKIISPYLKTVYCY
ncbi:uncharacterized protein LOC124380755 isoform X1 [Silurus meridionalis]|uniref:uncharacterized protein LOC124380755 isoform X1 n=1 Tax=Silurus meridionalis TaxID=175797 RepID=UPI001EEB04DC|nr:uncharacterized protein LOC124380755 isoform X1 [Silurus meridionalis]XP_046697963.1 uncharacterized protein LOC124380755 isoform X1 [Silurus meridionalis]